MPIDDEFSKIQNKILNNTVDDPRLARLTESIQSSQSFLNGSFLVENKKLKKALKDCIEYLETEKVDNMPIDVWNKRASILRFAKDAIGE
jgi:hypothetical protein